MSRRSREWIAARSIDPGSPLELLAEDLVGKLGICLATGVFHQLAHKEALKLGLATTERLNLIGMSREQLFNDGGDRSRIADHSQPTLINNRLG